VVGVTLLGGVAFVLSGIVIAGIACVEFQLLVFRWRDVRRHGVFVRVVYGLVFSVLYVVLPAAALVYLRLLPDGLMWLALVYVLTWFTDTFAYIGGRLLGSTPLAPTISPRKTVEGAVTGVIGGGTAGGVAVLVMGMFTPIFVPLLVIAPISAVIGDLVESSFKRAAGVDESHLPGFNLFPGHGGVLDRIDALIFVTTVCVLFRVFVIP
jgi:phosphatidate cytidylyltransferase